MKSEDDDEAKFRNLEVIQCLLNYGADTSIDIVFEHRNDTLNDTVWNLLFTVRKFCSNIFRDDDIIIYRWQPFFRGYVIAISSAVRAGQLNLACGPFLVSFLHRCMSIKDTRLVQGIIFRTYFQQFNKLKRNTNTKVSKL